MNDKIASDTTSVAADCLSSVREHVVRLFEAVNAIKLVDNEWQHPHPSSDCEFDLLVIEGGSTGIHKGYCEDGDYWVYDDEVYPSWPVLVKRVKKRGLSVFNGLD